MMPHMAQSQIRIGCRDAAAWTRSQNSPNGLHWQMKMARSPQRSSPLSRPPESRTTRSDSSTERLSSSSSTTLEDAIEIPRQSSPKTSSTCKGTWFATMTFKTTGTNSNRTGRKPQRWLIRSAEESSCRSIQSLQRSQSSFATRLTSSCAIHNSSGKSSSYSSNGGRPCLASTKLVTVWNLLNSCQKKKRVNLASISKAQSQLCALINSRPHKPRIGGKEIFLMPKGGLKESTTHTMRHQRKISKFCTLKKWSLEQSKTWHLQCWAWTSTRHWTRVHRRCSQWSAPTKMPQFNTTWQCSSI